MSEDAETQSAAVTPYKPTSQTQARQQAQAVERYAREMGRDGRKVDNEIINRYFERAVAKHECLDELEREEYSPRAPRRSFSGQNLSYGEPHHCVDAHHNSDPRDDSSPSVTTRPFPPPFPPHGSYSVVPAPNWQHPSGAPYPVWQPAAPARKESRTNPIPPPPPPVPPPPPPPPPRGWPCESPGIPGEVGEQGSFDCFGN